MSRSYCFCNNCGKSGHAFHQCNKPITSAGVIAFRPGNDGPQYLMIRRKDTLGFVDFVRGKYPLHGKAYIANIIDEMTTSEKNKLVKPGPHEEVFAMLWKELWGDSVGIQYRGEEKVSRDKFFALREGIELPEGKYDLASLVNQSSSNWAEPEWGFPKGRRNYQERDLHCAVREFEEETGYAKEALNVVQNLIPLEEIFTGSNYKSYKHRYFLALVSPASEARSNFQSAEVSKVEWKTSKEAMACIRPYNLEKKAIVARTEALLRRYTLYP